MQVQSLSLHKFRNLADQTFCPGEGINVIYGENAQGKTNLIEALWLFCGQKSFRGAKDSQLKAFEADRAELTLSFFAAGREQQAKLAIDQKRAAEINGISLQSPTLLGESFCAVVFAPSHMDLIEDGPRVRRSFLDSAISQLRPNYAKNLNVYQRAVMQRNTLLRDALSHPELEAMLDAFEARIAALGAYLITQRRLYLEAVAAAAPEIYAGISRNREQFRLEYRCSAGDGGQNALLEALRAGRAEDAGKQQTGAGPHRDDIEFFVDDLPLKLYGSQGQKRSAVLAVKLAEAEVLKRYCGEQPVAILDDVMSELDVFRQDFLLNHITGWQVFITCCDPGAAQALKGGRAFRMEAGVLTPV